MKEQSMKNWPMDRERQTAKELTGDAQTHKCRDARLPPQRDRGFAQM